MADQGNTGRVTRLAARKRAAEETMVADKSKRTRVVLGDIQNVLPSRDQKIGTVNDKLKRKPRRNVRVSETKEVKISEVEVKIDPSIDLIGESDDPQMCGAYVSDIYEYLHSMEMDAKRRPMSD